MKKRGFKNRKKESKTIIRKDAIILAVTFLIFILAMFNLANLTGRQVDGSAIKPAGDANLDGSVNIGDPMFITQYVNGMRAFTQEQITLSDVNSDGKATMEDAQTIADYLSGKIQQLPIPPPTKPPVPSRLKAVAENYTSAIILTWIDNADNEDGFKIYRVLEGTSSWAQITTLPANTITYTDKETAENTGYSYRVESYNSIGDSIQGSNAYAKTKGLALSIPGNIQAITTTINEVEISWDDAYNEAGYKLESKKESATTWKEIANLQANTVKYSDKLTEAGSYCYRIKTYNTTEDSQPSAEACISNAGCANECSTNDKKCSTTTSYQTCGNYDTDVCLEWGTTQNCNTGQSCDLGICSNNPAEICDNGIDDDKDSFKDILDSDCAAYTPQTSTPNDLIEICYNEIDDDKDKLIDSLDPDCEQTYDPNNDWDTEGGWQEYSWEDGAWGDYEWQDWQAEPERNLEPSSEIYPGSEEWQTGADQNPQDNPNENYEEQDWQTGNENIQPNEDIESEIITEEIPEVPESPAIYSCEGYLVEDKYTIINLEWEDNSENEESYRVDMNIDDEGWKTMKTLSADSTNYIYLTKAKLEEGKTIKIRIAARNKNGSSISNKCVLNT